MTYLYHDHLGSTVASSEQESIRYWPYGDARTGAVSTAYQYTGQRHKAARSPFGRLLEAQPPIRRATRERPKGLIDRTSLMVLGDCIYEQVAKITSSLVRP